ncbi:hypothetical protein ACLKM7_06300 [Microbacterium sp. I2]|uniref:hypothetical protein n=1 Tax=Microbacterium sp. I2 TaxID=3391826 RepID=UPI003EDB24BE
MEIATSRQLPKVVRVALIGVAATFAWIVLSFVLGLGASNANAAESDDGLLGGALGAVTSLVDQTASTVTGTVSGVTSGVTGVVNSVVDVAPAPVQQPVSQVVQSVGAVVTAVTQPVSDVVAGGVVSGITQPVVDVVTQVPVVGGIVSGIGLDDAVTDLSETVDDTLGGVVDAVDETGATVGQPPVGAPGAPGTPGLPGIPDLPLVPALPGQTDAGQILAADALTQTVADAAAVTYAKPRSLSAAWSSDGDPAVVHSSVAPSATLPGTSGVPGNGAGLCLASSSAGPGGAGPGAWAISALGPLDADRAWTHRAGPEDDDAPPAPVGSTDVSPD